MANLDPIILNDQTTLVETKRGTIGKTEYVCFQDPRHITMTLAEKILRRQTREQNWKKFYDCFEEKAQCPST